jgi:hypothetical protein
MDFGSLLKWLLLLSLLLTLVAALITLSSKYNRYTVKIIEAGFLIFFIASLIPPITTDSNELYEAFGLIICAILVGAIFGHLQHHEWVFDIISAFLFGVAVQLVLTSAPVEMTIQVFGLAVVTAGIARGVGLHGDIGRSRA